MTMEQIGIIWLCGLPVFPIIVLRANWQQAQSGARLKDLFDETFSESCICSIFWPLVVLILLIAGSLDWLGKIKVK
ncbi:MAG TPA: hypothetical protein VGD26_01685 [Chitinophagaceae bacterium]